MELLLKDIGKIREASIKIDGITVIAGENDTGKSTIGRSLFAVFNSFFNIKQRLVQERRDSIQKLLDSLYTNVVNRITSRIDVEEIAHRLVDESEVFRNNYELLKEEIVKSIAQYDEYFSRYYEDNSVNEYVQRIMELLNISDDEVLRQVLNNRIGSEFGGQISNIFTQDDSRIQLTVKNKKVTVKIKNDRVIEVQEKLDLMTEAIYLDDPYVLDDVSTVFRGSNRYADHRGHLRRKIIHPGSNTNVLEEILINNKLEKIYEKIDSVCSGDIVKEKYRLGYKLQGTEKVLETKNLSTGLKTFAILKTLLLNGAIEYNGTIILDEPEIHLHPEWQLLFAELIVLLHKEFNMHILLNTHSPYFLRALQVYSAKHGVADKSKYYLSELREGKAYIVNVTDNIEKIYLKLSEPLQKLEDMRWQND
ncbi:MAG: ATP-binding protein [Lachnospiraceae bacterium]|nr:ATP-binding protein [Lachnospiraceae bacterium]